MNEFLRIIVCGIIFISVNKSVFGQCEIKTYTVEPGKDTIGLREAQFCVHYKLKGKNTVIAKVSGQVMDRYHVLEVDKTEDYISLVVINKDKEDRVIRMTFFRNETRREVCFTNTYKFIEGGSGLTYNITDKVRASPMTLPENYIYPPPYWE